MRQLGHADPAFTLRVYAHSVGGGPGDRARLRELADGYGRSARELPTSNAITAPLVPEPNGCSPSPS